ncbi:hypothetical protein EI94DRAFT_1726952, partial [Lactarius quietus]
MSGNKARALLAFDWRLASTHLCHLAAGHTNMDERNANCGIIVDGLHCLLGTTI